MGRKESEAENGSSESNKILDRPQLVHLMETERPLLRLYSLRLFATFGTNINLASLPNPTRRLASCTSLIFETRARAH